MPDMLKITCSVPETPFSRSGAQLSVLTTTLLAFSVGCSENAFDLLQHGFLYELPVPRSLLEERRFGETFGATLQQVSLETGLLDRDGLVAERLLAKDSFWGRQQDSCPRASKARQIQPSASRVAAYFWRVARLCCSQGLPSFPPWQREAAGEDAPAVGRH
jgi:hypothetical protein